MKKQSLRILFVLLVIVSCKTNAQNKNQSKSTDCSLGLVWITGNFEKTIKNGSSSSSKTTLVTVNYNGRSVTKTISPTLLMQKLGFSIPVTCKGGTISVISSGPQINISQANSNPERSFEVYGKLFD